MMKTISRQRHERNMLILSSIGTILRFTTIGLFLALVGAPAAEASTVSKLRFFEVNYMPTEGFSAIGRPRCVGQSCRYVEIEVTDRSRLSVRSCVATETLSLRFEDPNRPVDDRTDRTRSADLRSTCKSLLTEIELTPQLRTLFQEQLTKKNRDLGKIAGRAASTVFWGTPTVMMSAITVMAAPAPISLLFGGIALSTGMKTAVHGDHLVNELLGNPVFQAPPNAPEKVQSALSLEGINAFYILPRFYRQMVMGEWGYGDLEPDEEFPREFNHYLEGWVKFTKIVKFTQRLSVQRNQQP